MEEEVAVTIPLTLSLLLSGQHQLSSAEPQHVHISEAGYFVQLHSGFTTPLNTLLLTVCYLMEMWTSHPCLSPGYSNWWTFFKLFLTFFQMVPQPSRTLDLQRKEELIIQKQIRQSTCKVNKSNLPTLIGLRSLKAINISKFIMYQRHLQISIARNCRTFPTCLTACSPCSRCSMTTPVRASWRTTCPPSTASPTSSDPKAGGKNIKS